MQNAFVESFNGRMRDECLNLHWFDRSVTPATRLPNGAAPTTPHRGRPESFWCDLEELGSIGEVEPRLDAIFGLSKHWDTLVRAHGHDALAGPAVAIAGLEIVAIQDASDQIIIGNQHKLTHGVDDFCRGAVSLSAAALGQPNFAMSAAAPMDAEKDLGGHIVDINHDLLDQRAYDALFQPRVGC